MCSKKKTFRTAIVGEQPTGLHKSLVHFDIVVFVMFLAVLLQKWRNESGYQVL